MSKNRIFIYLYMCGIYLFVYFEVVDNFLALILALVLEFHIYTVVYSMFINLALVTADRKRTMNDRLRLLSLRMTSLPE